MEWCRPWKKGRLALRILWIDGGRRRDSVGARDRVVGLNEGAFSDTAVFGREKVIERARSDSVLDGSGDCVSCGVGSS